MAPSSAPLHRVPPALPRTVERVAQAFHSLNEIEPLAADGSVQTDHRSKDISRYFYKHEMGLLLCVAGIARWQSTATSTAVR
jgi:L-lactate utilization protein LutB